MARIKLSMPEKIIGRLVIPVRITDINYGNHVGNDALVSIIHEARTQWLNQHGYTELNIEGSSIIMNELCVNYLHESFYGDELVISIAVGDVSTIGLEIYYQIGTLRDGKEIQIALAKTGIVFFDYSLKKVCLIPEAFISKLKVH